MDVEKFLRESVTEFELVYQRKPTELIVTWDVLAEMERKNIVPDMKITNSDAPFPVLRVK